MAEIGTLATLALGGVSGAVLGQGITTFRERARERSQESAAHWLVRIEMGNAHAGATGILSGEPYYRFPTDAWEKERAVLTRALPEQAFAIIAAAYSTIHGFNWRFDADVFQAAAAKQDYRALTRSCARMRVATRFAIDALTRLEARGP